MSTRGLRFLAHQPLVGSDWFHGAGDRRAALAQLRNDFDHIALDLSRVPTDAPILRALTPTLDGFDAFYAAETASTLAPWITEWSVFEDWKERVAWVRMAARAAGVTLTGSEPTNLPKTLWERGQDGTGTGTDRAFVFGRDMLKIGLGVAAAIGIWKFGRKIWRLLEAEGEAIEDLTEAEIEHEIETERERERDERQHGDEHSHHHRHHDDVEIEDAELVE